VKKFMMASLLAAVVFGFVIGLSSYQATFAQGQGAIVFAGTFNLAQAVPPPAVALRENFTGAGVFFFNPEDNVLVFQVALTNLTSSIRALQFHNGPAGEVGPPIQTICGEGPAGVIGVPLVEGPCQPGTSHVMQQRWTLTAEQAAELLAGNIYVNVHTEANFTPGEIRAQLNRL